MLRLYQKDHRTVLLPLGGSQLINDSTEAELAEIMRISTNISAIIDSERREEGQSLEPARAAFEETCRRLGITCHVLERRAIESYFSDAAVKKIKGEKYRALAPYELLKHAPLSWSKTDNWRIVREMTRDELDHTDLGSFLTSL